MNKNIGTYFLITPCKNEEKNLPNLFYSMIAQNLKPILWVIVDDGSTDRTREIIEKMEAKNDWIKGIHLNNNQDYDVGTHLAFVCNEGFNFAMDFCKQHNLEYVYVALIDADNIPEKDYFKKLVIEFESNDKLGIASGNSAFIDVEKINDISPQENEIPYNIYKNYIYEISTAREDLPMGSARMWRKECFEATGSAYSIAKAPDSVANIKAKLRGWETKRFMDIMVIERKGQSKHGFWTGFIKVGESNYYRGFGIHIAILKAFNYSIKKPYYIGIAFLLGYMMSTICRKERINDREILKYYQYTRSNELKEQYKSKIKKLLQR